MVRFSGEIAPNPQWVEIYDRMMPIYAGIYEASSALNEQLDRLS
jgi:hypothetical protein